MCPIFSIQLDQDPIRSDHRIDALSMPILGLKRVTPISFEFLLDQNSSAGFACGMSDWEQILVSGSHLDTTKQKQPNELI